ncbi:MAG: tetraacyldisaccharide 4'-kinase, partial [Candidatus Omnitrophica bacterium]|nr:tetraacyldisaccharide 4'-kinase [Candidatus Omnitrophota bacterium]
MKERFKEYLYNVATSRQKGVLASILRFILLIFSYLYWACLELVIFLSWARVLPYYKPEVKVISVGNITMGGTGKTPFEEYLIKRFFISKKVALVSRGYNSDELNLLQYNLPGIKILSGKNRAGLIKRAIKYFKPDLIVLDDGFQQWRVSRDINIVLIDAICPFGNQRLIPRGLLREPVGHLRRADIFVLTKAALGQANLPRLKALLKRIKPEVPVVEAEHRPSCLYEPLKDKNLSFKEIEGKKVLGFCAIGSPSSFRATLSNLGAEVSDFVNFIDHYQYKNRDIDSLINKARAMKVKALITTEKDWMRLDANMIFKLSREFKFYVLKIKIEILKGEERLDEYISGISGG